MDARLRLDHSLVALEQEGGVYGLLELRAPEPEVDGTRPRLAISLVIDRSGSMKGEKLRVAKSCAGFLAGRITTEDRLAVVAYDDNVSLVAALQGPGPQLKYSIDGIFPGGRTNLSGGWLKGVELLQDNRADVRRVLLLTDGLANVGIVDRAQLSSMADGAAGRGVTTTTIGFGERFDHELLSAMSDAGRGRDHFAASPEEAPSIFAQEFEGLATMVAQNLSVEVRPVGPTLNVGIVNEFPITTTGTGLQAALGDVYGGQTHKLVFRLQISALAELGQIKVAEVVIRWSDVTGGDVTMHTRTVPVMVNVSTEADAADEPPDSGVTEQVLILRAARARTDAQLLAAQGDFDGAQQLLQDHAEQLGAIPSTSEEFTAATDDIEELKRFVHRLRMRTYDGIDEKMLWEQSRRRHKSEPFRKRPDR
jgi:Ca-activated chloride channel family protein